MSKGRKKPPSVKKIAAVAIFSGGLVSFVLEQSSLYQDLLPEPKQTPDEEKGSSRWLANLRTVKTLSEVLYASIRMSDLQHVTIRLLMQVAQDPNARELLLETNALEYLFQYLIHAKAQGQSKDLDLVLQTINELSRLPQAIEIWSESKETPEALLRMMESYDTQEIKIDGIEQTLTAVLDSSNEKSTSKARELFQLETRDTQALRIAQALVNPKYPANVQAYGLMRLSTILETLELDLEIDAIVPQKVYQTSCSDARLSRHLGRFFRTWLNHKKQFADCQEWVDVFMRWLLSPVQLDHQREAIRCLLHLAQSPHVSLLQKQLLLTKHMSSLLQFARELVCEEESDLQLETMQMLLELLDQLSDFPRLCREMMRPDQIFTKVEYPMQEVLERIHEIHGLPPDLDDYKYNVDYQAIAELGWVDTLLKVADCSSFQLEQPVYRILTKLLREASDKNRFLQAWAIHLLRTLTKHNDNNEAHEAVRQIELSMNLSFAEPVCQITLPIDAVAFDTTTSALATFVNEPEHYRVFLESGGPELVLALGEHMADTLQGPIADLIANFAATCSHMRRHGKEEDDIAMDNFPHQEEMKKLLLQMQATTPNFINLSSINRGLYNIEAFDKLAHTTTNTCYYRQGIHLLNPGNAESHIHPDQFDLDVVFVHGLRGHPFRTWRTGMGTGPDVTIWPSEWLARDLGRSRLNPRLLTLGYEAGLVTWSTPFRSLTLKERARIMLDTLVEADIGTSSRPVVFVTHSMGGLLVKEMLVLAAERTDIAVKLVPNTRGIVFLAVPHNGGNFGQRANQEGLRSLVQAHPSTKDLAKDSPHLKALDDRFRAIAPHTECLSLGEQKPAPIALGVQAMVVLPESADPGYGAFHLLDGTDHMDICKPTSESDERYWRIRDFILETYDQVQASD